MDPWLEAAGGALAKVARCCGNDAQARSLTAHPCTQRLPRRPSRACFLRPCFAAAFLFTCPRSPFAWGRRSNSFKEVVVCSALQVLPLIELCPWFLMMAGETV